MAPACRLAVVIIARDEARCIARCLRSVTSVADKVLVLDTGSVDDTPQIARSQGAEVHTFLWADDFAAARNHALDLAGASWNILIDADEWLVSGHADLVALASNAPVQVGQVRVDSVFDREGDVSPMSPISPRSTSPSWISRLMPYGVRYTGRVHEQPCHALPVARTAIVLAHDGYLAQHRPRKAQRNRRLLERDLAERPDDPYIAYQLGKDHDVAGEFGDAAHWYESALARQPAGEGYAHDLLVRQLHALKCTGRHAAAVQLAEQEMAHWPVSPDFYFALGDVLLDWAAAEPSRADELLPMAEASWKRCIDLGESDAHEGAVAGRGSWLAAHNLAVICNGTGRPNEAAAWRASAERSSAQAASPQEPPAPPAPPRLA